MRGVTFDDASHTYRINGVEVPSVTQLLHRFYVGPKASPETLASSAARGTKIHALTAKDDAAGRITSDEFRGWRAAWQGWREESGFKPTEIELVLAHEKLAYAGTIDRIGEMADGSLAVVDLKTGRLPSTVGPQLALYTMLAAENDLLDTWSTRRIAVQVGFDGRWRAREFRGAPDFVFSVAALMMYYAIPDMWERDKAPQ